MKFTIEHQRALTGNDITVGIDAEDKGLISRVLTQLDGFDIGDDTFDSPIGSYERQFLHAGDASPLLQHELIVRVTDPDGTVRSAAREWQDVT